MTMVNSAITHGMEESHDTRVLYMNTYDVQIAYAVLRNNEDQFEQLYQRSF